VSLRSWAIAIASATTIACAVAQGGDTPASSSPTPIVTGSAGPPEAPATSPAADCHARIAAVLAGPALPGAPAFEARRVAILGRARGEPVVFVRAPASAPDASLSPAALATRRAIDALPAGARVDRVLARHRGDRATARSLLLREGYAYAEDPAEALALVTRTRLVDLFDEPTIGLVRGSTRHRLELARGKEPAYRHVGGPLDGRAADLLFGDRVAVDERDLAEPLHRDLRGARDRVGFDRVTIEHLGERAIVADLAFGAEHARALFDTDGASPRLACLDVPDADRPRFEAFSRAGIARRRSLAALSGAVDRAVVERLPFDRPRDVKDHFSDGRLRPLWQSAYRRGQGSFSYEGEPYPVFDGVGRPAPPEMCIDFVLDSFERAADRWFRPRGEGPERTEGRLDLDALGITNRAGVMAFAAFAEAHPGDFDVVRLAPSDRIEFGDRDRFFRALVDRADLFAPGDVVAIHGLKRDGYVHQHAILVEDTDPVTGAPVLLADQMRWPRRRTWEGIMAEAPKRSLTYRVRFAERLLARLDPDAAP
jgi:hypothetical protein